MTRVIATLRKAFGAILISIPFITIAVTTAVMTYKTLGIIGVFEVLGSSAAVIGLIYAGVSLMMEG